MRLRLALLLFSTVAAPAMAQIAADRPGLTTGTAVVPAGHGQTEIGLPEVSFYTYAGERIGAGIVPVLVRIGVGRGVELRASTTPFAFLFGNGRSTSSWALNSVEVGAKVQVVDGPARLSLVPSVNVPIDEEVADWTGGLIVATEADLTPEWGLSASANIVTDFKDATVPVALSVERTLGETSTAYGEVGTTANTYGFGQALVGAGLTQALGTQAQADVFVQRVLGTPLGSGGVSIWNVGAGLSMRF